MENRINIAELLKDCPKGMELDCALYEDCEFLDIDTTSDNYLIRIKTPCGIKYLDEYGCYTIDPKAKCVIFPKGKTSWEGFRKPFKDGDIVATENGLFIGIIKVTNNIQVNTYCAINNLGSLSMNTKYYFDRLATEEERQKLFKAIKDNGFRWNAETKTLEKLVNPNFKVGNKIIRKGRKGIDYPIEVLAIENGMYKLPAMSMPIDSQDEWELVSDKFDISTLKPFESRVLVRNADGYLWKPAIYGFSHSKMCYVVGGLHWVQCIPYEENKHLIGTTDDCSDFYKTWEK